MLNHNNDTLLTVRHLKTYFYTENGIARAVDDVTFNLQKGETLGLVGESGCGKSVTALSIIGLVDKPAGRIVGGEINLSGYGNLIKLAESEMREIRGNKISIIFQQPMTSLSPVFRIGDQIVEAVQLHQNISERTAHKTLGWAYSIYRRAWPRD